MFTTRRCNRMGYTVLWLFLLGAAVSLTACAQSTSSQPTPDAVLQSEVTDVFYLPGGSAQTPVPQGTQQNAQEGDGVNVSTLGRALLSFRDYLQVEIYRDSTLMIEGQVDPNAPAVAQLRLQNGTTFNTASPQALAGRRVQVDTAYATIVAVGTEFLVNYDAQTQLTWVVVKSGAVEVTANQVTVRVVPHWQTWVLPNSSPEPIVPATRLAVGNLVPSINDLTNSALTDDSLLADSQAQCSVNEASVFLEPDAHSKVLVAINTPTLFGATSRTVTAGQEIWVQGNMSQDVQGWVPAASVKCGFDLSALNEVKSPVPAATERPEATPEPTEIPRIEPTALPTTAFHQAPVESIAFSSDGKLLASGNRDGSILIWDVASHQLLGEPLAADKGAIYSVAFSPSGRTLASGGQEGTVRLWDVESHRPVGELGAGRNIAVSSIAFSPDTSILAAGGDSGVILWNVESGKPLGDGLGDQGWVRSVAFSPDGKTFAIGSGIGSDESLVTLSLWTVGAREPRGRLLTGKEGYALSVAFSPDKRTLASGDYGGTLDLWDVPSQKALAQLGTGQAALLSLAFSPKGEVLATGGADGTIAIVQTSTHELRGDLLSGHKDAVHSLAFSPRGDVLASGSEDGTIILWDAEKYEPITRLIPGQSGGGQSR